MWSDDDDIILASSYNDFDVQITLMRNFTFANISSDGKTKTRFLVGAKVEVSRDEKEYPPPVIPDEKGVRDWTIQTAYFAERIKIYGKVACEAINRVIRFFKYSLNVPYMVEFDSDDEMFMNAGWTDANDHEIGKAGYAIKFPQIPGIWGDLGVEKLTPDIFDQLQYALNNPPVPTLFQQIRTDARTALFEKNLRRGILELAIACEILVKQVDYLTQLSLE